MAESEEIREKENVQEQNSGNIIEITCSWHLFRRFIIAPGIKPEWLTKSELLKVYDTAIRENNEYVKELKYEEAEIRRFRNAYESLNPIQRFFLPKKIKKLFA